MTLVAEAEGERVGRMLPPSDISGEKETERVAVAEADTLAATDGVTAGVTVGAVLTVAATLVLALGLMDGAELRVGAVLALGFSTSWGLTDAEALGFSSCCLGLAEAVDVADGFLLELGVRLTLLEGV